MAKETMKDKIARLEHELELQKEQNNEILQKLYQVQDGNDNAFKNSPYCIQLERDIETYKQYKELYEQCNTKRAKEHDDNVRLREEVQELINEREELLLQNAELEKKRSIKVHNERGAGRKPSMTSQEKQAILKDRSTGMTFKQLSEKHGYSVGIIHKLISESQNYS